MWRSCAQSAMRVTDLLRVTHLLSAHQAVDVSQKVAEHRIADVCNVRPARPTAYPVLGEVVQLQLQLCKLLICGLPLGLQECKFRPSQLLKRQLWATWAPRASTAWSFRTPSALPGTGTGTCIHII